MIPKGNSFWIFGEVHRRPVCVRRWIPCFGWLIFVPLSQSQNGRDGRAPFFCREKSNFKETLVSRAFFSSVEHSNEHVHRSLSGEFVVLVHTRPLRAAGAPLVLDHEDIIRHTRSILLNRVAPVGC